MDTNSVLLKEPEMEWNSSSLNEDLFNFFLNDNYYDSNIITNSQVLDYSPSSDSSSSSSSSPLQIVEDQYFSNNINFSNIQDKKEMYIPDPLINLENNNLITTNLKPSIKSENINSNSLNTSTSSTFSTPITTSSISSIPIPTMTTIKNSNNRKRSSQSLNNQKNGSIINQLSREELLQLSGKKIENLNLNSIKLTPEEEKILKRQRRLMKNRESAQLSRLRKKMYLEELEKKVTLLTTENDELKKQLNSVILERNKLQEEINHLRFMLHQDGFNNGITINEKPKNFHMNQKSVKTAGVCLLIMLFSFGLLFNTIQDPSKKNFKEKAIDSENFYAVRTLQNIPDEKIDNSIDSSLHTKTNEKEPPIHKFISNKRHNINEKQHSPENVSKKQKMVISDEKEEKIPKELIPMQVKPNQLHHHMINTSQVAFRNTRVPARFNRPNTSYIFCLEAQHVIPTSNEQQNNNEGFPENIALLIPSNILNHTLNELDPSLLEVTCQVLNFHILPLVNITTN